jgi:hypothetical protein
MASNSRITKIEYSGALWRSGQIHPELAGLFAARDLLLVLQHGSPPYQVTFGVPHQAAAGVGQICNLRRDKNGSLWPREADENAAFYALGAYSALRELGIPCRLVVMAHPTGDDPNKDPESPYCQEIFRQPCRLLFECHGSRSTRRHDLELSAGKNPLAGTLPFGRRLAANLDHRYMLAVQKEAGRSAAWIIHGSAGEQEGRLELPANRTDSLVEAWRQGLPALHLEAKPRFRTPPGRSHALSPAGEVLGTALARTIAAG